MNINININEKQGTWENIGLYFFCSETLITVSKKTIKQKYKHISSIPNSSCFALKCMNEYRIRILVLLKNVKKYFIQNFLKKLTVNLK